MYTSRVAVMCGLFSIAIATTALAEDRWDAGHGGGPTAGGPRPSAASSEGACSMTPSERVRTALLAIHGANQEEIELGKLAQDRAASPDVKQFADHMVSDHTSADQKLTDLAHKQNIDLVGAADQDPILSAMKTSSQATQKTLTALHGGAFDVAYVAPQASTHLLVLNIVEAGENAATNPDVKAFLQDARRVVSEHYQRSVALQNRLTLSSSPNNVGGGPSQQQSPQPPPQDHAH